MRPWWALASALAFYGYLRASGAALRLRDELVILRGVFDRTHNTWNSFKRISDAIYSHEKQEDVMRQIHRFFLNVVENLRITLCALHPGAEFRIHVRGIEYKRRIFINTHDQPCYQDIPFVLRELTEYADTAAGASAARRSASALDFDPESNREGFPRLIKTLFFRCFRESEICFCARYGPCEQPYADGYASGLFAPLVLHEIPFAIIRISSDSRGVFLNEDLPLIATFTDCLAELFRFELVRNCTFADGAEVQPEKEDRVEVLLGRLRRLIERATGG